MSAQIDQLIQRGQNAYASAKLKLDGQSQRIADLEQHNGSLQSQIEQLQSGVPADSVGPTQLADLEALVVSLEALAATPS